MLFDTIPGITKPKFGSTSYIPFGRFYRSLFPDSTALLWKSEVVRLDHFSLIQIHLYTSPCSLDLLVLSTRTCVLPN